MTEFRTYILYDLQKFNNSTADCIIELGSKKIKQLPYCDVIKNKIADGVGITYIIHNIFPK